MALFGAIEAGGTKFVCGVGTDPADLKTIQIPTTTPGQTLDAAIDFLRREGDGRLSSVGIGSFGPVDLERGTITSTPKAGWRETDLVTPIRAAFDVPVAFDTDVNAALVGEARWGAARGVSDAVYITVGTGIGGGAITGGRSIHGSVHPEMGHLRIPHDFTRDPFVGSCPFHGDCLEGLASGPAIAARWGKAAAELPADHEAWALEAHYLGLAISNLAYTLSPELVILGGGVMHQAQLFPMIRSEVERSLNGYVRCPEIVPPELGDRAGVLGALALAYGVT